ncbi:hypothetical protein GVY41_10995 [Frigidibacter albus]|uniref:RNA polymerase sigma-54 factor n=1 Tax=Frigidibacter albus TaxID=1465486 RepID=A0A6L8VJV1_9RHOB|nr:hypothetical protein [Frigidibacter albus]MZQ89619.1 hypothetical protein [Frigidibacter albus]NBE31525.1 hypothetical protein [Frigidibacter albus]GGH55025.1 hypothetical protein GCM10011341_22110 [Frigidibacter albus]
MSMTPGLRLSTRQRLALTPGMRQSLAILRLPALDLHEEIARLAAENPFIEHRPAEPCRGDWLLDLPAAQPSLFQSLQSQLSTQRLAPEVRAAALMLVAELREDGYLDATLDEIAAETGAPPVLLDRALQALQACDPPGIGARDLPECLALQLQAQGHAPALARAICAHLEAFAEGRWQRLARALGLPADQLAQIAALLPTLRPAPDLPDSTPTLPLLAELIVEPGPDGSPLVRLNPDALPTVTVAGRMAGASADLARAQSEAGFLVAALKARGATLLRIGTYLVTHQARHFASAGDSPLLPMTRAEAAAALAMHPATLGRAISGKALSAFGRTLSIEGFFSHGLPGRDGAVSAHQIQRRIRALIAAEPPDAPLADDAICTQLQKEGVDIARRTVAKYRTCMRIASSFERRRRKVIMDRSANSSAMNPPRY